MNVLRRILLALYSLLLLAAVGGFTSLAWNQDEQLDLDIGDLNIQAFVESTDDAKYLLTGALAAVALLALFTILIAIWPRRDGSRGTLRIKQADGGLVDVTPKSVEVLLRDELEALPEVRRAVPTVRLVGGAIDTRVEADIEPSASIAHATKLLTSTVEYVLREHVGVGTTRRPLIRINYDEATARPIPARQHPPRQPSDENTAWPTGMKPQQPGAVTPAAESVAAAATEEAAATTLPAAPLPTVPELNRPPEAPRFVSSAEEVPPYDDRT